MNITLMEKVYKNNQFVLYVNGFVGVISKTTIIESAIEVLKSLDYNITDVNYLWCLNDDVPNNEANYWYEGPKKSSVHLTESNWEHNCNKGCCFDNGYKVTVNSVDVVTQESVGFELLQLLERLEHTVTVKGVAVKSLCKPGNLKGDCLEIKSEYDELHWMEYEMEYEPA